MNGYVIFAAVILFFIMLFTRVMLLRKSGVKAVIFSGSDYILLPFAALFLYEIVASTFNLPLPLSGILNRPFFNSKITPLIGIALCALGLISVLLCLISFGKSFRIGIDRETPDKLVTTGMFSVSRNPIYVSFLTFFLGIFLSYPNFVFLFFLIAGFAAIHRQILREERFLKQHYGNAYLEYCKKVRRYL